MTKNTRFDDAWISYVAEMLAELRDKTNHLKSPVLFYLLDAAATEARNDLHGSKTAKPAKSHDHTQIFNPPIS